MANQEALTQSKKTKKCKPLSCACYCCVFPQRILIAMMLHFAVQTAYNLRMVLNVGITVMVEPEKFKNVSKHACPELTNEQDSKKKYGDTFAWPRQVESLLLYSFFIGYLLGHIPGGILADKWGGRWVLLGSICISVAVTVVFPICIQIADYWLAVLLRTILGFAQGPIYPCLSTIVSHWIPPKERNLLGGIAYSGAPLGTVVGSIFTGLVVEGLNSWKAGFYFWSVYSLVYITCHLIWVYSYPNQSPHVTPEELSYIEKEVVTKAKLKVPWLKILSNGPFWASLSGQFGHNYFIFIMITYLPLYMKDILAYNIEANSLMSALPFFLLWMFTIIYSALAGPLKRCCGEKFFNLFFGPFSNISAAICILGAMYAGCSRMWAIILYCVACVLKSWFYCTMAVNQNELSKNYGGTLMAIVQSISIVGAIAGSQLIGYMTSEKQIKQWRLVFWISFGVTTATTIIYVLFAKFERQPFDFTPEELSQQQSPQPGQSSNPK